jgi:hypothetical protein
VATALDQSGKALGHELLSSNVFVWSCLCLQVKMAVSRKLCGAVIGQKGQTIRDFMLDSGATIRVQVRYLVSVW